MKFALILALSLALYSASAEEVSTLQPVEGVVADATAFGIGFLKSAFGYETNSLESCAHSGAAMVDTLITVYNELMEVAQDPIYDLLDVV